MQHGGSTWHKLQYVTPIPCQRLGYLQTRHAMEWHACICACRREGCQGGETTLAQPQQSESSGDNPRGPSPLHCPCFRGTCGALLENGVMPGNPDKYKKRNQNLFFVEKELDLKIGQETFPLEATLQIEYKIFALDRSRILCHLITFLKSSLFLALKIKVRQVFSKSPSGGAPEIWVTPTNFTPD